MMKFTPLYVNTEYSFQESTIKIDELILEAQKNNLNKLAITDHNSMFGISEFIHKAHKANINPIIGLDLDVENYRFILLAKNYQGYVFLNNLSSKKMKNQNIFLEDIKSPDIFIIDHPSKGYFYITKKMLNFPNYFIGTDKLNMLNGVYVQEGKILFSENKETLKIFQKIKKNNNINIQNIEPLKFNISPLNNSCVSKAIEIASKCNIIFPKNDLILPFYKTPNNEKISEYFKKIIKQQINLTIKDKIKNIIYQKRLNYEINLILKQNFETYFLIIWDLLNWIKKEKIKIGPGRGSVAGSLVAYILQITEVDPLKFDLLFERFLNPVRINKPDIDIDIQDNRRNEVIKYIFEKYGSKKVALISVFSRLGSKSAIREIGRMMNISLIEINHICKFIISNQNLKLNYQQNVRFKAIIDSKEIYTKLFKNSLLIESLPKQFSTHASGIIISNQEIENNAPTIEGPEGYNQIQYPADYLEQHNLLKIDLLGLNNLTIIQKIQNQIFKNYNQRVNLKKIPLNDEKTNNILTQGETDGIFQLESYGMKNALKEIKVSSIDDIIAIISLYRPGPMEYISLYAKRKNEKIIWDSVEKSYDQITKNTYGIIIYQEQIMEIATKFSGMSLAEADILRIAISKKKSLLIDSMKKKFFKNALEKKQNPEIIEKIFKLIEKFANYGFNKSHAVCYALIAYRMAYLKSRFKLEFYSALIDMSMSSSNNIKKYILKAKKQKIQFINPRINFSQTKTINDKKNTIILPFQIIKGISEIIANKIIQERDKGDFINFFDFIARAKLINLKNETIELLIKTNTLIKFGNMATLINSFPLALRYANLIINKIDDKIILDKNIISEPELIYHKKDILQEILNEKKIFGFYLNSSSMTFFEKKIKIEDLPLNKREQEIVFFIEKINKFSSKKNKLVAKIFVLDSTSEIELMVFDEKIYHLIENNYIGKIVKAKIQLKEIQNKKTYILRNFWKEITENEK